jgi:peroxisomal 2,4-dienoyl-CoA reductase
LICASPFSHVKGSFNTSKAAFPYLKERGGTIINISATLHYTGMPFQVHAASAKAGIDSLTQTLVCEWRSKKELV